MTEKEPKPRQEEELTPFGKEATQFEQLVDLMGRLAGRAPEPFQKTTYEKMLDNYYLTGSPFALPTVRTVLDVPLEKRGGQASPHFSMEAPKPKKSSRRPTAEASPPVKAALENVDPMVYAEWAAKLGPLTGRQKACGVLQIAREVLNLEWILLPDLMSIAARVKVGMDSKTMSARLSEASGKGEVAFKDAPEGMAFQIAPVGQKTVADALENAAKKGSSKIENFGPQEDS